MKKFLYTVFLVFIFVTTVSAATTKNGVPITPNSDPQDKKVEVSCKYSSGYTISFLKLDRYETDGLYDQGRGIPDGIVPNMGEYLLEKGFMTADGYYDCPKYALYYVNENNKIDVIDFSNNGTSIQKIFVLIPEESSCIGACQGEQFSEGSENQWVCDYQSTILSGTTMQTKYDGVNYILVDRDGYARYVKGTDIRSDCGDIFLDTATPEGDNFRSMDEDIRRISDLNTLKDLYNFLCFDDKIKGGIDYYCAGSCKYPNNKNNVCSYLKDKVNYQTGADETEVSLEICQNNEVKKSLRFVGRLLVVVKIIVPLLLIVFGFVDFGKVVISSDNEASNKAIKRLTMRIITGVVIFILPTIINFVFGLFPKKYHFIDCSECIFKPTSCQVED